MMGGAKAHYDGIVAFSQTDFTDDLKKITVPVLVMHGDDDQIVPYANAAPLSAKLLKNGTLKTYKGFPHGMPTTQADTINADLLTFIRARSPPPLQTTEGIRTVAPERRIESSGGRRSLTRNADLWVTDARGARNPSNAAATTIVTREIGRRNANDTKFMRAASRRLSTWPARFSLTAPPSRKYDLDLASPLINECNLFFNNDVAEAAKVRCQLFRLRWEGMKLDFRRHKRIQCDRETAAGKRRGLLRNQLRDPYLLLKGKNFGL